MTSPILVTGGTGTLGRRVVRRLRDAGRNVRVLSRRSHDSGDGIEFMTGDLATGEGLEAAVNGVETIVHLAGSAKGDEDKARNLVRAASSQTRLPHLVYISVVGADRIPVVSRVDRAMFGYFASKRAAERVVADSGLPWTTLRATQFHDLILTVAQQLAKLPMAPLPAGFRFQPVDADEVAARLVELSLGEPAGLVPDMGGPRVYGAAELLRGYLRATKRRHRPIVPAHDLHVSLRTQNGPLPLTRHGMVVHRNNPQNGLPPLFLLIGPFANDRGTAHGRAVPRSSIRRDLPPSLAEHHSSHPLRNIASVPTQAWLRLDDLPREKRCHRAEIARGCELKCSGVSPREPPHR
jgi:uncharacterized protein YbjT (DUF2867 family)